MFDSGLTHQLFPTLATPYLARATPSSLRPGPGIPGHLQPPVQGGHRAPSLSRALVGESGSRPDRLRPAEAAGVLPVHCTEALAGMPLTSWVWRAAAARRGRGEAAGFWPGWDMARLRQALPPGGRSGDWKGGPGGDRWKEERKGAEGATGAPVRQLFRPSPEPVRGLPLAPLGPPLPARCWP